MDSFIKSVHDLLLAKLAIFVENVLQVSLRITQLLFPFVNYTKQELRFCKNGICVESAEVCFVIGVRIITLHAQKLAVLLAEKFD